VPIVLVEPQTARILFSNQSADDLWGGPLPKAGSAEEYQSLFRAFDASGNPVPSTAFRRCGRPAAEEIVGQELDLETPRGRVMALVDSARVPALPGHPETIVLTFRDVTKLLATETGAAGSRAGPRRVPLRRIARAQYAAHASQAASGVAPCDRAMV